MQANADSQGTLKVYIGCMEQLQRHLHRIIYNATDLFERGDVRQLEINPVTMQELLQFLEIKRQNDKVSKSTVQGFKAAVSKFRARNGFPKFSTQDLEAFKRYFRGLGNYISQAIRDGEAEGDDGKRHLKREELLDICGFAVTNYNDICSYKFGTEIHLFVLFGWNLCARSDTTSFIHSSHLDWEGDCLKIGIAKSKRNYNTSAVYYHVYANPLYPLVCPVLSLAVHLICSRTILANREGLFRQTRSKNQSVVNLFSRLVRLCGLPDIGSHSIRKGAITYASTGTPDVLPAHTVSVRSRWKSTGPDGTVHKRYVNFTKGM